MLPVLLDISLFKIYTFGVFLVLAFFWSTFILWKNIRLTSYKENEVFDGLFISLVGALLLGRLIYIAFHFEKFGFSFLKFILINGYPGLSLYGIVIGGLLSLFAFCSLHKIKFRDLMDYFVPPMFVALAIGKIGSFLAAVEVGSKTDFLLALRYVNFDGTRHLTPLYEGIFFFLAAFLSYRIMFAIRREKVKKGINFFFFLWYFSLVYFIFDPLKASRILIQGYSANWIVAAAFLLTFTLYFLYYLRYSLLSAVKGFFIFITHYGHKTQRKAH